MTCKDHPTSTTIISEAPQEIKLVDLVDLRVVPHCIKSGEYYDRDIKRCVQGIPPVTPFTASLITTNSIITTDSPIASVSLVTTDSHITTDSSIGTDSPITTDSRVATTDYIKTIMTEIPTTKTNFGTPPNCIDPLEHYDSNRQKCVPDIATMTTINTSLVTTTAKNIHIGRPESPLDPECIRNTDCQTQQYCQLSTSTCEDPCEKYLCKDNHIGSSEDHQCFCKCRDGFAEDRRGTCVVKRNISTIDDEHLCAGAESNPHRYLVPHPYDCSKFISCQRLSFGRKRWKAHLMNCGAGTFFSQGQMICDFKCKTPGVK
jgi:hypothetical protein